MEFYKRVTALNISIYQHITAMPSSLTIDEQVDKETQVLTRLLNEAPEETIDKIAERVIALQELNKQREVENE